jgi:hypothetical protein
MIKTTRCLALAFLLLSYSSSPAEVKIKKACRIANSPPGRCGWCAVETLARHHHLKALYGLSQTNDSRCSIGSLEDALAASGVTYRIQYAGEESQALLKYAVQQGLGAVVGFRELYPGAGGHIVTLIDFTEDSVQVIDSNDQDHRTRTMSLDRFLYWWDGFALVLEPTLTTPPDRVVARAKPEKKPKQVDPASEE